MQFSYIDGIVLAAYMLSMLGLGLYQTRKIKNTGDYFAGGRTFNKFLMMMHALGTGTHADDPVNVVGASFQRGLSGIWYTFVYLFITPFYWLMAPLFRRSRYLTTADFFEARFGKSLGLLYTVWAVIIFSVNMGMLLKGTGMLTEAVTGNPDSQLYGIAAMMLIFLIYGVAGGLHATVITESVQGLLIVVMSLLLVPFGLFKVAQITGMGAFQGLHHLVDAEKFSLHAPEEMTIYWIIAAVIVNFINIVAQPHTMEVCSTGKTEFEGRVGFTYGNFVKRLCAIGWAFTGVIVLALVAGDMVPGFEKRELAFGVAIKSLLPAGFIGLMFAAILAAQMSTLSAFMVASSALVSNNIYKRYIRPDVTDQQLLVFARVIGVIVVGLGVAVALMVPGVAEAVTIFWALAAFTGVFMWAGVLWRRTNATGAWVSFITMLVIWLLLGPIGPMIKNLFPGVEWLGMYADKAKMQYLVLAYLPAGVVTLIVGSLLGKSKPKEELDKFYLLLKTPVGMEHKLEEAGVETIYTGANKPHPWEVNHPKLVNIGGFLVAAVISMGFLGLLYMLANIGK